MMGGLRTLALLGLAVLLFLSGASAVQAQNASVSLTDEEQTFIAAHPMIRVQSEMDWPPFDFVENGQSKGFSIDYLRLIAQKTGLNLEFVTDLSWAEIIEHGKARKLDILHTLYDSPERREFLSFSKPYVKDIFSLFVLPGSEIQSLRDMAGKKLGVVKGDQFIAKIKEAQPDAVLVEYSSTEDILKAVVNGEVDGATLSAALGTYYSDKFILGNLEQRSLGKLNGDRPPYYIGARNDWPELLSVINKGADAITRQELNALREKWFGSTAQTVTTSTLDLTAEERAFLKAHPIIKVTNETDWPPFDFVEEGRPAGYSIDYMKLLESKIPGTKFEFVNGYTWAELLEMFKNKQLDVFHSASLTADREEYTLFTRPYMNIYDVIVTKEGRTDIHRLEDLAGKTLAVIEGYYYLEFLPKEYPDIELVYVDTPLDAFHAVASGRVDAYMDSNSPVSYMIKKYAIDGVQISGRAKFQDAGLDDIRIGVRDDWAVLHGIIEKAMDAVTAAEENQVRTKWFGSTGQVVSTPTLDLSETEQAFLKAHPVIKVSNETDWPPFDFVENGKPAGYSIDYVKLLQTKIPGLKFEFVNGYTWAELLEMFENKELDMLQSAAKTADREPYTAFTEPYMSVYDIIVTRSDQAEIYTLEDLSGKTLAVIDGYNFEEIVAREYPEIKTHTVGSPLDALHAVSNGTVDAYIDSNAPVNYLIKKYLIPNIRVAGRAYMADKGAGDIRLGVRKDWPVFYGIIEKAVAAVSVEEENSLQQKWFGFLSQHVVVPTVNLSAEEKAFAQAHPVIRIAPDPGFQPIEFFDKNGQYSGVAADFLKLIGERTGLRFEFAKYDNWGEIIGAIQAHDADMMGANAQDDENSAYLNFTTPYFEFPMVLLARKDAKRPLRLEDMTGRKLGVTSQYPEEGYIRETFPNIDIVSVPDVPTGLRMAASGEIEAMAVYLPTASHHLVSEGITNLTIAGEFAEPFAGSFAVRKDWPELTSILQKGLNTISEDERTRIFRKWISLDTPSSERTQNSVAEQLGLTLDETAHLGAVRQITYCGDPDWMPYERINSDGNYEGMVADFLTELSTRMGTPFRLHTTETWAQTLEGTKNGQCDIIAAAAPTEPRREWLDFTNPHFSFPLVIAVRSEELFVEDLAAVQDKSLAVVKSYAHIDLIRQQFPNISIVEVDNVEDGLHRVQDKEVFGFIDTVATIGYSIRENGMVNLKIGGKIDIPLELSIAMRKGEDPVLLSILDKAIASFSDAEMKALMDKWITVTFETGLDYTLLWQVMAVGGVIILVFVFWNRKQAAMNRALVKKEEELRKSETKYRSLVETSQTVPFSYDIAQDRYTYMGAQVGSWLGYPVESWTTMESWANRIHPDDRQDCISACMRDTALGVDHMLEYRVITPSDDVVWVREFITVTTEDSNPTTLTGFMFDVTGEKEKEGELRDARDMAESASQAKSDFLANMSHEIRTPLNAVLGFGYLAEQTDMTDEQKDFLGKIQSSAQHLLSIIDDILDFSRVEAGKLFIDTRPFDLDGVLDIVMNFVETKSKEKGLKFKIAVSDDVPRMLIGDPLRLEQVLGNLASNAVKFTPQGEVNISVQVLGRWEDGVRLGFEVRDTGIGMNVNQIEKIFSSFQQADTSITRRFGGTGLGLAISKRLIEMMGGDINVESEEGQGSLFRFTLPLPLEGDGNLEKVTSEPEETCDLNSLAGARILLVEDQPLNQEVAAGILQNHNLIVDIAQNGQVAVDMVKDVAEDHYDAVLMDIQMPVMDGCTATQRIREFRANLPIIAMTAHALKEQRKACKDAGMDDYLVKPISVDTLCSTLSVWVDPTELRGTPVAQDKTDIDDTVVLPDALPGLDIADGVKRVGNDPALFKKYLLEFPKYGKEAVADIKAAVDDMNWQDVQRLAHTLKGTAAAASATGVQNAAESLDDALRQGQTQDLEKHMASLEKALTQVLHSIASLDE